MSQLKPFALLWFILILVWVGNILVTDTPAGRLDATCLPINGMGKAVASVAAMSSPQREAGVTIWFSDAFHGCRGFLWRQFYADEVARLQAQIEAAKRAEKLAEKQGKESGAAGGVVK